jgi:hypothetical protein
MPNRGWDIRKPAKIFHALSNSRSSAARLLPAAFEQPVNSRLNLFATCAQSASNDASPTKSQGLACDAQKHSPRRTRDHYVSVSRADNLRHRSR